MPEDNFPHRDATFIERMLASRPGTFLTTTTVLFCIAAAILMQGRDIPNPAPAVRRPSPARVKNTVEIPAPPPPVEEEVPYVPPAYKEPDPEKLIEKLKAIDLDKGLREGPPRREAKPALTAMDIRRARTERLQKNDRKVLFTHGEGAERHSHNAAGYKIGDPDEHKHAADADAVDALLERYGLKDVTPAQLEAVGRKAGEVGKKKKVLDEADMREILRSVAP